MQENDNESRLVDVTFCFLVTKDLVKEQIWRAWFDRLRALKFRFNIITHVSPRQKAHVQSDWLWATLLPDAYLVPSEWAWVMQAQLALYAYALAHAPAAWYTLHSESCVPLVTPERFIEQFQQFKAHTFLRYGKAWWTPTPVPNDRANLHLLPTEYHWAHPQWSILCHEDLAQVVALAAADENQLTSTLLKGHAAEESFLAIFLYKINNFKNVIKKATTLVDWARSPGGGSPYTFHEWTAEDEKVVAALRAEKDQDYLFMRKIGPTFPDEVLRGHPLSDAVVG